MDFLGLPMQKRGYVPNCRYKAVFGHRRQDVAEDKSYWDSKH